jgi:DNA polymerase I-like protein with 3'-5' exonuclease and polymerase domains
MLVTNLDELDRLVEPLLARRARRAAFDTETTPVEGERFTPFGTDTRMAGFSFSYNLDGEAVDFYASVRHVPYDWRRREALVRKDVKNEGAKWADRLLTVEGVLPEGEGPGWREGMDPNLPLDEVLKRLRAVFDTRAVEFMAHNWSFDAKILLADGVDVPWGQLFCTQAASVLTDTRPLDRWVEATPGRKGHWFHEGHSLDHLGRTWLGASKLEELKQAQAALGKGGALLWDYSMLPLRTCIAPYGCLDTRLCLDLGIHEQQRESWDESTKALFDMHRRELPYVVGMERRGWAMNPDEARAEATRVQGELDAVVSEAYRLSGNRPLHFTNPKELSTELYDVLKLPKYRDATDTREATLKKVRGLLAAGEGAPEMGQADSIRILDLVLAFRKLHKQMTAFYEPLAHFAEGGRIHPTISPLRARTTRMAASGPNTMQAAKPKKSKDPAEAKRLAQKSVRYLFKADPGHTLVMLDYAGQELRTAAHYALVVPSAFDYRFTWRCTLERRGDCKGRGKHGPNETHVGWRNNSMAKPTRLGLAEGFLTDQDFDPHQVMVELVDARGFPVDRDGAKTADFAIIYGCGIGKLSDTLDIPWNSSKGLIRLFWEEAYPELGYVKQFIAERLRRSGPRTHYSHQEFVRTMHGGRVYLDSDYKALNYLIQRSCREILGRAIVSVGDYLAEEAPSYELVSPVHDELILSAPTQDLDQGVVREVARRMVMAGAKSKVPHVVEPKLGRDNWAEKESAPKDWGFNGVTAGLHEEATPC